jgi:hypothetical protein
VVEAPRPERVFPLTRDVAQVRASLASVQDYCSVCFNDLVSGDEPFDEVYRLVNDFAEQRYQQLCREK